MQIPFDVALGLAIISLAAGCLIGAAFASRRIRRFIATHYDYDYSAQCGPALKGESARYFQHDYSGPVVSVARRVA